MSRRNKYNNWLESEDRRMRQTLVALAVALILIVSAFLCSCRTTYPMPTNTHNRDSIRTEYVHDSISIDRWHTIYIKGDSVFVHDSIWRDRWHTLHDTIRVSESDTIYQQVVVEKKGSGFWKGSGIAFWVLIGILVVGAAIGLIIKFAK